MTTIVPVEITCSCCGVTYGSRKVTHIVNLGPVTTDILEMTPGEQPIRFQVFTCPSCGYTTSSTDNEQVDDETRRTVAELITPRLREMEPSPARNWEFLAVLQEAKGLDNFGVGSIYLRAVWCASLDGQKAEEREYRRKVIEYFQRAFAREGVMEDRAYWTAYLIGEMYRRLGDIKNARTWFDTVINFNQKHHDRDFWVKLALQQKTDPVEYIRKPAGSPLAGPTNPSIWQRVQRLFAGK